MYIKINDLNINYETYGDGEPLVILHGWLANLETMAPISKYLSKKFKVYAVDVVGFGKSDLPKKPLNSDAFGDFLKEFLEQLNIKNPILIGHSNGGRMIINAVGRGIISPDKIVLIDSAGIKPKRKINYYFKVYTFKFLKNILNILPNNQSVKRAKEQLIEKFSSSDYKSSPEVLRKTMSIILNEDLKKLMPNIKVPTLLIWGTEDSATPIQDAKKMEELIPDAGLVEFKGAGHFSYLDRLHECLIVLDEFLK